MTTTVPFSKLKHAANLNAREAAGYSDADISELAALIKAKGLLQPLIVRSAPKGVFEIMAGGRRFRAIAMLIKSGDWPADAEVPVVVREDTDLEALETSLVENIARKPMHPVQEFVVFARLHSAGTNVDEIAKRYGITARIVRQRLALGGLAPEIRDAWSKGQLSAETAQAFAACRDKKQQAAAYKQLSARGSVWAHAVRQHFVKDRPKLSDPHVAFVGLDRYKAAGGTLVESLFADDGYLEDGALLQRLVQERVAEVCDELVADGWSYAIPESEVKPAHAYHSWASVQPKQKYLPEEATREKELEAERDKLQEDEEGDHFDRIQELEAELEAITDAVERRGYSKKQKAESGCIVRDDGSIIFGRIRGKTPAQLAREKEKAKAAADGETEEGAAPGPSLPAALLVDITAMQTRAVHKALMAAPSLAVRLAAAALAPRPSNFYGTLPVRLTPEGLDKHIASAADDEDDIGEEDVTSGFAELLATIPAGTDAASLSQAMSALALHLGRALDFRTFNASADRADAAAVVAALPGKAYLEAMRSMFDPADYFKRASAAVATEALEEMAVPFERGARKAQLAEAASAAAAEQGWLPVELRHPDYAVTKLKAAAKKKAA